MMLPARIITGDTSAERIREAAASGSQLLHKPLDTHLLRAANAVSQEVTSTVRNTHQVLMGGAYAGSSGAKVVAVSADAMVKRPGSSLRASPLEKAHACSTRD